MRSASEVRGGRAAGWAAVGTLRPTLCLIGLLAAVGSGCTQPQSGIFDSHWCHPGPAEGQPYVILDDMEDGDSAPCSGLGKWTAGGSADFAPLGDTAPKSVGGPALPSLLGDADQNTLDPMFRAAGFADTFRAYQLQGTIASGGYGSLILPVAMDLSSFPELDFWARTDAGSATLVVGMFTADGRYFSEKVTIQAVWEVYSAPLLGALFALDGTPVTAADLATAAQLEFRFAGDLNGNATSFSFWLDDVVVKR